MKTKTFQPRVKMVDNNTSLGSIMSGTIDPASQERMNKRMHNLYNNNISGINSLSPYQKKVTLPVALEFENSEIAKGITHINKRSIMKTFVRKSGVLAIGILIATLFFTQKSFGQPGTMGRWEMCGLTGTTTGSVNPAGVNANVTFSVLSRGSVTAASATNGYNSRGWSTSTTLSIANADYYEFTITPSPGYKMSLSSIKVRDAVSTVASSFDAYLRFSDDGYASNVVASMATCGSTYK